MGNSNGSSSVALNGRRNLTRFLWDELKPRGKFLTVFNVISIPVILLAAVLVFIRFRDGLASVTNLSQGFPWGIWIGFDVMTGVAFAGGAYVITFMVYILGLKKYRPIVRATVLNGLLAYMFYAGCLLLDVGRPWNVFNPFIGNAFGVSSIMFLIAWHFMLYIFACIVEFSPAVAEWLGMERTKKILSGLTVGAVIIGITLSTLHQSGLGALFVMAKSKLHPLWYTEFLPALFFVSSIFAGLSMVIFECTISHKVFAGQMGRVHKSSYDSIILGLSKICAVTMFVYLFMVLMVLVHNNNLPFLETPMGVWYLTEILGFVAVPLVLFVQGYRNESKFLVRIAAVLTMVGIILNRLNVSVIAYKWYEPVRYFPSWMEIEITLAVIFIEIWIFRWIVRRMAILNDRPAWARESKESAK